LQSATAGLHRAAVAITVTTSQQLAAAAKTQSQLASSWLQRLKPKAVLVSWPLAAAAKTQLQLANAEPPRLQSRPASSLATAAKTQPRFANYRLRRLKPSHSLTAPRLHYMRKNTAIIDRCILLVT